MHSSGRGRYRGRSTILRRTRRRRPPSSNNPTEWAAFRAPSQRRRVESEHGHAGRTSARSGFKRGRVVRSAWLRRFRRDCQDLGVWRRQRGCRTSRRAAKAGALSAKVSGAVSVVFASCSLHAPRRRSSTLLAGYVLKRSVLEQAQIRGGGSCEARRRRRKAEERTSSFVTSPSRFRSCCSALGKASDNFLRGNDPQDPRRREAKTRRRKAHRRGRGRDEVDRRRIGANDDGVVIKNGSGLYDANRTTAFEHRAKLLRFAWQRPGDST